MNAIIKSLLATLLLTASCTFLNCAKAQQVTNILAFQEGTNIKLTFNLSGINENQRFNVIALYTLDDGKSYLQMKSIKGDLYMVTPGYTKTLLWDVLADREPLINQDIRFKIIAEPIAGQQVKTPQTITGERKKQNNKLIGWGLASTAAFGAGTGLLINSNSLYDQYQSATDKATELHQQIVLRDRIGYAAIGVGALALVRLITLIPGNKSGDLPLAFDLISDADYAGIGFRVRLN